MLRLTKQKKMGKLRRRKDHIEEHLKIVNESYCSPPYGRREGDNPESEKRKRNGSYPYARRDRKQL